MFCEAFKSFEANVSKNLATANGQDRHALVLALAIGLVALAIYERK